MTTPEPLRAAAYQRISEVLRAFLRAPDRRVVQCNYTEAVSVAATGARAYLVRANPGGGDDRIVILVRSRGGRWIEKWESIRRVGNFRPKTLPPEHPLYGDERIWDYDAEAMAARLTAAAARAKGAS
jgi:hypothetical protein